MPKELPRLRETTMRFVEHKTEEQLNSQTLHQVCSRLVAERTNLIDQLRAILLERGVVFPAGRRKFELGLDGIPAGDHETSSPRMRKLASEMRAERQELDARIEALNGEIVDLARHNAAARGPTLVPGVGALNATALGSAVGSAGGFRQSARPWRMAPPGAPATHNRRQTPAAWQLNATAGESGTPDMSSEKLNATI